MLDSNNPIPSRLLDIDDIARYLGTRPRHIRRLIAERRIPHHKVGGLIRFRIATIDRWLAENERASTLSPAPVRVSPVRSATRRRSAQTAPTPPVPGQLRLDQ
jgi:excisionase family DNA binding protein